MCLYAIFLRNYVTASCFYRLKGASVSQPQALEGVREHILNEYVPDTSGFEVGNH